MMNEHVSAMDWVALFSTHRHDAEWMRLQSRVMAHVNACEQCRELYEKGKALSEAAQAMAQANCAGRAGTAAFRAVASADAPMRRALKAQGRLSVCLDSGAEGASFIEDTLELEGCANKYALNPEDDGKRLLDDDDALRLELSGGVLKVSLGAGEPGCDCLLLSEDEGDVAAQVAPGESADLPLPPDSFCTLEITFAEGR